jgi:beta-N-acetylhexosaminidase
VKRLRLLSLLVILLLAVTPLLPPGSPVRAQAPDPLQQADALLARMTPQEKVAQLFLVTFEGTDVSRSSRIYSLIFDNHIGGVILRADNDNFTGPNNLAQSTAEMIGRLQTLAWDGSQAVITDPVTGRTGEAQYVPLLVGVSQEGDLSPYDQLLSGMTALPNPMAIGATWDADLSRQVGAVLGTELKALGFNLFIGPSLDVLDVLHAEGGEDLGTRTFGGDPYWVSRLGQAYIQGLHEGSANGLAVIAKHFPGRGGSDRPPDEEVATVRKSLEQLKQIELAPFFAVTGRAPDSLSTTDGLLVSHIRYQGFQGNIRATTRPISLDQAALEQVLNLEELKAWRDGGGIVISDDLGSSAIRRSYDPTGQTFDARRVAVNAFLAGNDLLYVDDFVATNDQDAYTTILRTLEMFTLKYEEDPAFAERVDLSVRRVLALKYRLYPEFSLDAVLPQDAALSVLGRSQGVTFEVARQAVTLISPDPEEMNVVLPRPPELSDRIIFLTDVVTAKQCSTCSERPVLATDAMREAVLRLYGPSSGGQILDILLSSYSFNELSRFLDDPASEEGIENDLRQADWVVVAMLNTSADRPASWAFERLLSERPDLLRNKRVIAFAFNAPYYLDATDISQLTAYYGLYSKSPAFVDVAARILFQEISPAGALPVSVPGVGYDLITATSPDPNQIIPLFIEYNPEQAALVTGTPEATPVPEIQVGDTIGLRTGVIYDHNGNPVPDGTVVRFLFTTGTDVATTQQSETETIDGVAASTFRINSQGVLEIRVVSDPATVSPIIRMNVIEGQPLQLSTDYPTPAPTETPSPTPTLTPTITPSPTPTPIPPADPSVSNWFLVTLTVWIATAGVFWIGRLNGSLRWAVRWGLLAVMGGLGMYLLLMLVVWDGKNWLADAGTPAFLALSLAGVLLGWAGGVLWQRLDSPRYAPKRGRKPNESA